MKFMYQAEKFANARRALMLPHPKGEVAAINAAFLECFEGLQQFKHEELDDDMEDSLRTLRGLMDTSDLKNLSDEGLFTVRARSLTTDQISDLSRVIDELATWFEIQFRTT